VIAQARVWLVRHGGRMFSVFPFMLAAERGLDEVLPRMSDYVGHARSLAAALAEVDGISIVPDPPQTAMFHVYVRGELDRLEDTLFELAKETGTLLGTYFAPTSVSGLQRTEINIGPPSLDVPTGEIAELYGELVKRAARPRPRRGTRPGSQAARPGRSASRRAPTRGR